MKRKILASLTSVILCFNLVACGGGEEAERSGEIGTADQSASEVSYDEPLPEDYEGTLTIWGWDDPYYNAITAGFNELYPNVTFEYTPMANGDSLQKYQTAVASATELPDLPWAIVDSRAKLFELDMWEDLSAEPYNFDINDVYDYTHQKLLNSASEVCGIEQNLSPAGYAYRKDLALEYLGTDDPEELEAMLSTWDDFAAKGAEVYEKSGGTVFMLQGPSDAQQFAREQDGKSWIEGDVIKVTDAIRNSLEIAVELRDNNATDNLEAWSPAWYASFGEGKHIFTGCATWSVPFNIEPNDPEGETTGHWALMSAPGGNISWGGTTTGISKTCEDKRLAWEFIKYSHLSTEGAEVLNSIGYLTSAKQPYIDNPDLKVVKSLWFGDQDLGVVYFDEIIPEIKPRAMNIDDNIIHETLNLVTTSLNNDSSMTADDAVAQLEEELEIRLPDYNIE
ncbi:MAG: ABC transporter substrate-binding protein [Bacilli bacterium]